MEGRPASDRNTIFAASAMVDATSTDCVALLRSRQYSCMYAYVYIKNGLVCASDNLIYMEHMYNLTIDTTLITAHIQLFLLLVIIRCVYVLKHPPPIALLFRYRAIRWIKRYTGSTWYDQRLSTIDSTAILVLVVHAFI